ncbi:MAG: cupredoxin family copper-binding protein [Dehalococcoidia bacterium]|nr:cupredoxin family copper-binding protein [Dehalococcoidia bacterium]
MHAHPGPGPAGTVALAAAVVAVAAAVLVGGVIVAIAMGGGFGGWNMQGHMGGMMNRAGNSPQTPVVASQPEVSVEIRNFEYFPRDLTVDAGATVTWTNRDSAPHTATHTDGGWDTGILDKGESAAIAFDAPGAYGYFCSVHPAMKAILTVR